MGVTAWIYIWRTTPVYRRELEGDPVRDSAPALPAGTRMDGIQPPEDGSGAFLRRRYRGVIHDAELGAAEFFARVRSDPNVIAPTTLARFHKVRGDEDGRVELDDEYTVRMPGPWDGPVRVIDVSDASFRFATLDGHLEAGQIEWRVSERDGHLCMEVESWSRPGDRVSDLLHHRLRMAKEVQLHMWTSVIEKAAKLAGGRLSDGIDIETRVL